MVNPNLSADASSNVNSIIHMGERIQRTKAFESAVSRHHAVPSSKEIRSSWTSRADC